MKTLVTILLVGTFFISGISGQALAADNWYQLSAQDAINSTLGKEKLRPEIGLYMKGQSHPKVLKKMGEFKANQRTNGFGKSAESACERVFVSALMALQSRAEREGGNAVIDIYTITKDKKFESATEYSCIKGGFVTNVALKGTVVKLAK